MTPTCPSWAGVADRSRTSPTRSRTSRAAPELTSERRCDVLLPGGPRYSHRVMVTSKRARGPVPSSTSTSHSYLRSNNATTPAGKPRVGDVGPSHPARPSPEYRDSRHRPVPRRGSRPGRSGHARRGDRGRRGAATAWRRRRPGGRRGDLPPDQRRTQPDDPRAAPRVVCGSTRPAASGVRGPAGELVRPGRQHARPAAVPGRPDRARGTARLTGLRHARPVTVARAPGGRPPHGTG